VFFYFGLFIEVFIHVEHGMPLQKPSVLISTNQEGLTVSRQYI